MTSDIEKVAKAIYTARMDDMDIKPNWDGVCSNAKGRYLYQAEAAIAEYERFN